MKKSQTRKIAAHLVDIGPITPLEALSLYQCFRLGARVRELRKDGMNILTDMVEVPSGARVARYRYVPRVAQPV